MNPEKYPFLRYSPFVILLFRFLPDEKRFVLQEYSETAEDFFGFEAKDIDRNYQDLTKFWGKFIHKDDIPMLFGSAAILMDNPDEDISFTCRAKNKDGNYRFVAGYVKGKKIEDTLYAYCYFFEIQDMQFLSEQYLIHSLPAHLVLEDVLKTTPIPIYWVDEKRKVVGANPALLQYFGIEDTNEIIGKSVLSFPHLSTDARERVYKVQLKAIQEKTTVSGEKKIKINGKNRNIQFTETPMVQNGRVVGLVGAFEDITKFRQAESILKRAAEKDFLTGLFNRRSLFAYADSAMKNPKKGERVAVLMIDVDRFKKVNDQFGHEKGDALLKKTAAVLKDVVKGHEGIAARLGGDEFVIVLLNVTKTQTNAIVKTIHKKVKSIALGKGIKVHLDVSIGFSYSKDITKMKEMLDKADKGMYKEKKEKEQTT